MNWIARETNRYWMDIAGSHDGTKLVAVAYQGQIYTSTDSGATWTARENNRQWTRVASSSDGTKLVAVVDGGQIYTSTDSGVSWTPRESNRMWNGVASSSDGTKLVAVVWEGQIYTSTNGGISWIEGPAYTSNRKWWDVTSNGDGTQLAAASLGNNNLAGSPTESIWMSYDGGVTWSLKAHSSLWNSIASSNDGSKLIAADRSDGNQSIWTSHNYGEIWTRRLVNNDGQWFNVAMSDDGTKLVAASQNGRIYTSTDSGITWTQSENQRFWRSAISNIDGSKLVAVVGGTPTVNSGNGFFGEGGQIYTNYSIDPNPSLTPTPSVTTTPTPTTTAALTPPSNSCDKKIIKLYIPVNDISPNNIRASSIQLKLGGNNCCGFSNIVNIPIPPAPPPPPIPEPDVCMPDNLDLYGYTAIVSYDPVNCTAGHVCNRAIFDFYIDNTLIGTANLNNLDTGGYKESVFVINEHIITTGSTSIRLDCALTACHNGIGRVVIKDPQNNIALALCLPNDVAVGSLLCPTPTPTPTPTTTSTPTN